MTRHRSAFLILAFVSVLGARAFADESDKAPQGKGIFTKYKCRSCHSVASESIKKSGAPVSKTAKHKPPDLSSVGVDREHEWIEKWLQREEKIDGRMHPIRFRGTKDEREALAAWLETLKTPKEGAEGKPAEKAAEPATPATPPPAATHDSTGAH